VVEGLEVAIQGTGAVQVEAGYALDVEGATLLWPRASAMAAPPGFAQATTVYLVISQPQDEGCGCEGAPRRFDCSEGGADPIVKGVLSWKTVDEVRLGEDVLLARVLVANGHIGAVDSSVRRRAAGMNQPRLWSDSTLAGLTGWTDASRAGVRYVEADIDASQAGFLTTPAYSARVAGAPLGATGFIAAAGANHFRFAVRADAGSSAKGISAAQAEQAGWTVAWFAVEVPAERLHLRLPLWRLT
jgi:hypothetical protein